MLIFKQNWIVTLKFREIFKVTNDSGCEEFPDRSLSQKTVLAQSDIHDSKICPVPIKILPFDTTRIESTTEPVTPSATQSSANSVEIGMGYA